MLNISVKLLEYTWDAHRIIAVASKTSLSRKPLDRLIDISNEEVDVWIRETYRRMHFSPWEHASYTFIIDGLSRIASHQLVRHRHASYTQMSHRYTEGYLKTMALEASKIAGIKCEGTKADIYKCYSRVLEETVKSRRVLEVASIGYVPPLGFKHEKLVLWAEHVTMSTSLYYKYLSEGVRREDARYVIPDSVRTRITVTMNARELIQVFLPLRLCTKAQWEIRFIAWRLWGELMTIHPQLWRYAGPSCVFRENTQREWPVELEKYLKGEVKFTIPRCPELVENKAIQKCLLAGMKA
ncbi:MAG: FAD-dependent thymidylate synthase [Acidilobaceae archaeon]